jgi:hypothetical protein
VCESIHVSPGAKKCEIAVVASQAAFFTQGRF